MSDDPDDSDRWNVDDYQDQQDDSDHVEEREMNERRRSEQRQRDEKDHEDFYDRYHNFPDDQAMASYPGSAAWKKLHGTDPSMGPNSHPGNVKPPESPPEPDPNWNVRPGVQPQEDADGNR